jgi:hypothetical protein
MASCRDIDTRDYLDTEVLKIADISVQPKTRNSSKFITKVDDVEVDAELRGFPSWRK